jgi:hypothetical protein
VAAVVPAVDELVDLGALSSLTEAKVPRWILTRAG